MNSTASRPIPYSPARTNALARVIAKDDKRISACLPPCRLTLAERRTLDALSRL